MNRITDETEHKLLRAFAAGLSERDACMFAGVSLRELREHESDDVRFAAQRNHARPAHRIGRLGALLNRIGSDPAITMWFLERIG